MGRSSKGRTPDSRLKSEFHLSCIFFSKNHSMDIYVKEGRLVQESWTKAVSKDSDSSVTKVRFDSAINQHFVLAACAMARETDAFENLALLCVQCPFDFSLVAPLAFVLHNNFQG